MMPAGKYYVGDLCYVMHHQWDEFCAITINEHQCLDGEFVLKNGVRFATYGTQYGDGTYQDLEGRRYAVDAGLIGCIRLQDIQDSAQWIQGGQIIEFDHEFHTRSQDGTIHIGHVAIHTGDEMYDYEEDE